jgi:uncharacterized protein with NRDE domain
MCYVLLGVGAHPQFPLIIAANRDEFHARPALSAHWWTDSPGILGGRDQSAGGSWFGVTAAGRFAVVTNVRRAGSSQAGRVSRGELVTRILASGESVEHVYQRAIAQPSRYNPFNLLYGDQNHAFYVNNEDGMPPQRLDPGIYALSNHRLDTPWPKVIDGKRHFGNLVQSHRLDDEDLFGLLSNPHTYETEQLPDTGLPPARERALSAIFIEDADYGTRCSTVFRINRDGTSRFEERNHAGTYQGPDRSIHTFSIDTSERR